MSEYFLFSTADMTNTFEIYVGNLGPGVDESKLRAAFAACGPIHSLIVVADRNTGVSKVWKTRLILTNFLSETVLQGYGFIHFNSQDAQQKAVQPPFSHQTLERTPGFLIVRDFIVAHRMCRISSDRFSHGSRYHFICQWPPFGYV